MGTDTTKSRQSPENRDDPDFYDIQKISSYFSRLGVKEALMSLLLKGLDDDQMKIESTAAERERKLALQAEAARIRWLLAVNPNTPAPVLEHLSRDNHPPVLERIGENPRAHVTTLIKLSMHNNPQVRAAVAENTNLSLKTVWRLCRDENADVRLRLAESYTVPIAVLRVLSEDENPYVADRAQTTMKRILEEVSCKRATDFR
ncbi:MAG TPA: hypothetical protein V6C97_31000 [Oculatellaceae cyanobacterium]